MSGLKLNDEQQMALDQVGIEKISYSVYFQKLPIYVIYVNCQFILLRVLMRLTQSQFRNEVKDCKLNDSSDEYLLKWLNGQILISLLNIKKVITELEIKCDAIVLTFHLANKKKTVQDFDVGRAEKMLRQVWIYLQLRFQ